MRTRFVVLLFAVSFVSFGAAAQKCDRTADTILECWQQYNPDVAAAEKASEKVAKTNTGVPGVGLPTETSLRDFLSFFTAAVDNANVSESDEAITLDWNIPVDFFGGIDKIKLQAIFTNPALSEALTKKFTDANNSAAITALTDSLSEVDDVKASATFAPENARFGRSLGPHNDLLAALMESANGDRETAALQALAVFLPTIRTISGSSVNNATPLSDLSAADAQRIESLAASERALGKEIQTVVDAFATLLNNQPQIYGTVIYHSRDRLVGANELSAKFTLELGRNNLNGFLGDNRSLCEPTAIRTQTNGLADESTCISKLAALAKEIKADAEADASNRLALSIEYQQTQHNKFDLAPTYTVQIDTPGSHSLIASLKYGIPLATVVKGREARFDIALNYDNVSNDADRDDRFIGSITYTQKLSDTLALPLSLVYANHAKYLPESDRELSVHFGLTYKLLDLTP